MTNQFYKQIYSNYTKLSGSASYDDFVKNLDKFLTFTRAAYIDGDGCRKRAYTKWVKYIKDDEEADRYFKAVDQFSCYS